MDLDEDQEDDDRMDLEEPTTAQQNATNSYEVASAPSTVQYIIGGQEIDGFAFGAPAVTEPFDCSGI